MHSFSTGMTETVANTISSLVNFPQSLRWFFITSPWKTFVFALNLDLILFIITWVVSAVGCSFICSSWKDSKSVVSVYICPFLKRLLIAYSIITIWSFLILFIWWSINTTPSSKVNIILVFAHLSDLCILPCILEGFSPIFPEEMFPRFFYVT